jgi:carboxylesterase type B
VNVQENMHYGSLGGTADQAAAGPPPYGFAVLGAYPYFSFELVADGTFFPAAPVFNATSGAGLAASVDLMAGFNADEGALFVDSSWTAPQFNALIDAYFPSPSAACAAEGMRARFNGSNAGYADAYASLYIKCPTRTLLQSMYAHAPVSPSAAPPNLYLYQYAHVSAAAAAAGEGATHGAELPYLFGNDLGGTFMAAEATLGGAMRRAWVTFAATGTPGVAEWARWDPLNETYMRLDTAFPDSATPRFATAAMPKSACQFMEATPSTPTCGVLPSPPPPPPPSPPPSPPAAASGGVRNAPLWFAAAVLHAAALLLLC